MFVQMSNSNKSGFFETVCSVWQFKSPINVE